jgi:hypothetical protein
MTTWRVCDGGEIFYALRDLFYDRMFMAASLLPSSAALAEVVDGNAGRWANAGLQNGTGTGSPVKGLRRSFRRRGGRALQRRLKVLEPYEPG